MTPEEFVRMRADMNRRLAIAVGIWISEVGVDMLEEVRALSEGGRRASRCVRPMNS